MWQGDKCWARFLDTMGVLVGQLRVPRIGTSLAAPTLVDRYLLECDGAFRTRDELRPRLTPPIAPSCCWAEDRARAVV